MKNPGIKIPYLRIDHPIVEETRCVEIRIPDDDSFMPVLAGLVAIATKWFNYERDDTHKGAELARIWRQAYLETDWEGCMNCEELTACIGPLLNNQTQQILELIQNINEFGTENPGQPMTIEELEENIAGGSNPDCDHDILWAQCLALVQFTNRQIEDILERIEAATNVVELAGLSDDIPVVGFVLKTFGVELATNAINYFQEAVQEAYLAEYTTDKENELACQLFCMCSVDCTITVDRVYNLFYSNIADEVPSSPIDVLELLTLLAGIDLTQDTVVDLMFWSMWGLAKLAQFMFESINATVNLQLLLDLAVNDANNDWELLCVCPEEPNIWLVNTSEELPADPVFLSNTDTGSVWQAKYYSPDGIAYSVAVTPQIGGINVCCKLISATPVLFYQHLECGGGLVNGSGAGESPPDWAALGFQSIYPGTIVIQIEPV